MFTQSDEGTKKWWPADFRLKHRATFGKALRLELEVTNTGKTPLRFEEALHAYYRVHNIETTRVHVPDALYYYEGTDLQNKKTQLGVIQVRHETDRLYVNTRDTIALEDCLSHRRICIAKQNSLTTVVWNPWVQKAHSLSDFGETEWERMICIEPCNVSEFAVELGPGQQHTMSMTARVVDY